MNITKKEIKDAASRYSNQNFKKVTNLQKEDMVKVCKKVGYTIPPYLAVEAYLVACGGHKVNGEGPFDTDMLHSWLI